MTVVTAHTAKVTVVTKAADLPGGAADLETALLDLAIRKTGTNRFRYQFTATPAWVPGTVTVDFAADSFKNADVTGEDGNPIVGTSNAAISLEFHVEGATANVIDPGAGGSVDVNALNDRNWLDVLFQAPTGFEIDSGSVIDAGAEFTLTGPGLGTITVDSSRAPIQLGLTGLGAGQKVFRYWLVGKYAADGRRDADVPRRQLVGRADDAARSDADRPRPDHDHRRVPEHEPRLRARRGDDHRRRRPRGGDHEHRRPDHGRGAGRLDVHARVDGRSGLGLGRPRPLSGTS